MGSALDYDLEHRDAGFLVNFVDGIVNPFGVVHFEALIGWVVLEEGFQLVKWVELRSIADGGSRVLVDEFSQIVACFL